MHHPVGRLLRCILSVIPLVVLITGCTQFDRRLARGTGSTEGWSQIRLPGVPAQAAFEASRHAIQQWFRIDETLPTEGQIRSVVTEFDQKGGTGRLRDATGRTNRMRRTAIIQVESDAGGSIVRCAVEVQRLDTADHRVFSEHNRFEDYQSPTPIDREASVTADQDQVWSDVPRDRQLEQDILSVVRARATGQPPVAG